MQKLNPSSSISYPIGIAASLFVVAILILGPAIPVGLAADRTQLLIQAHYFDTGYDEFDVPLLIPSIDPAGIAYHPPSGHLFIADSEINEVAEVFGEVGGNIFEISLAGDSLLSIYDTTIEGNNEPTGITFNEFDGHFYMSNDDARKVYRYSFSEVSGFSIDAEVSTLGDAGSGDPEGITSDPATGLIYLIDGVDQLIVVYSFDEGAMPPAFVLESVYDLAALNDPENVPADPEGIAFDTRTGNLFISSDPDKAVYEFTTGGLFVEELGLDTLTPATTAPQGLCLGPVSPAGGDLDDQSLYIADGRVDNDADPNERDGSVYEVAIVEEIVTNLPPVLDPIADQSVDEDDFLTFTASAADQDDPPDGLTFSLGGVVHAGANIDPTTGVFSWTPTEAQAPQVYGIVIRVTDDGLPPLSDDQIVNVTVNEINEPPVLDSIGDQVATGGSLLTLTATASDPDRGLGYWDEMIAYWPFDSDFASGTGGHSGTPQNGAAISTVPDEFVLGGGALSLDGVNDYVDFVEIPLTGDLTISAWINPANIAELSNSNAILLGDGANADWLRLEANGVRCKWNNATIAMVTEPDFVNLSWQHFFLVRNGSQLTVYRNGQLAGSGTHAETFTPEFHGLKTPNTNYYQGFMDDVAIWERALTTAELGVIYNGGDGLAIVDVESTPLNTLTFSLEGTVPDGASIDPLTGVFTWVPGQDQTPGVYTFAVRVTDDGTPSYFDEEYIAVTVESGSPVPPVIDPIDDKVIDEEENLSFIVTLQGGSGSDIVQDLEAYYPFDVDFGDKAGGHDGAGAGNPEIITSDVKLGIGALYLDGAGDYLDVGDIPLDGDLSLSVWIMPEAIQSGSTGGANGILLGDSGNLDWLRLELDGVRAKFNGSTVLGTTNPDFVNGIWQHFMLVRSGSQVSVYRDNAVVTTFTHTQPFTPEYIGCKISGGNYYQGIMDDLALWSRALDTDEVASVYNEGNGLVLIEPDLSEGLAAYWPFDTDYQDAVGSHDGTEVGDPEIVTGDVKLGDGALYLDGLGDYLNIGDISLTGDLSISAWILPEAIQSGSGSGANGILLGDAGNLDWLRIELEGVRAKWNGSTVAGTTDPDFVNGLWQHFILVRSGSQVTVYRDNGAVATFTHTQPFTPEYIGCKISGGNYYQGTMDDLAIWTRALDAAEINALYNDGAGRTVLQDPGDSVIFSLDGSVPNGVSINSVTGFFEWTPDETQGPAMHPLVIRATDTGDPLLYDTEEFTVTVNEVNLPPVLDAIADQSQAEGDLITFAAAATDPDVPANSLSYSLGGAEIAGMTINPITGMFTWTPAESQGPGVYSVTVRVVDDSVPPLDDEVGLRITVTEVNSPPVLDPIGDQIALLDTELIFTASVNEPDLLAGLTDGLIAYWPFDSTSASETGTHDGTPMNGAAITHLPSEIILGGGALNLDGADDYLDFGNITLPGDFSLSAWIAPQNIDTLTTSSAVVFGDGANADWLRLEANGVRAKWDNVTTEMTSEPDFLNGSWQLFTLTRAGDTVSAYRNGELVATGTITAKFTPEYLGLKTPNPNYYSGQMDDVAVWSRVLAVDEIALMFNGGAGLAIGGADAVPANALAFSLEGVVPEGAGIDPVTGVFSWTPTAEQAPGEYTFSVRTTDDGTPPLHDEEEITVRVFEEPPPPICNVDPPELDFATVAPGDSLALTFSILNTGYGILSGDVGEVCDQFRIDSGAGPFELGTGDSLVVTVIFEPQEEGEFECIVTLGAATCTDVYCMGQGAITSDTEDQIPVFTLMLNCPNPFNPTTRIDFGVPVESNTRLVVYNIAGRRVRTLVDARLPAGFHAARWDGCDDKGNALGSGVYLIRLSAGGPTKVRKLLLVN
jgi:Concanavalin A-like lectin/glucanases superfamily/FlgD Ig-like domain/Putative Ig domain